MCFPYSNELRLEESGKVEVIGEFGLGADHGSDLAPQDLCERPARDHVMSLPHPQNLVKPIPVIVHSKHLRRRKFIHKNL